MTRTKQVLSVLAIVVAVGVGWLAYTVSHNAECGTAPPLPEGGQRMKAITLRCYGPPEKALKLEELEKPVPADNELLVKVHAAAVNPLDWHYMRGEPYVMRMQAGTGAPSSTRLGVDFAGTVEAVGKSVTRFKPGDEIFGAKRGAFGEYVAVPQDRPLVMKPANVTFEQAASVPIAAITALQALRDKGHLQAGQKVLINGASGGVGTFAVQIAKSMGAEVTGVCSTRNVDMVRSIGADHVIDYTQQDFTQGEERYDLIVDNVGNHTFLASRRVLKPDGIFVIVGGPSTGKWIGALTQPVKAAILNPFVSQQFVFFLADINEKDLTLVADLMQAGKVTPVIDRRYSLSETPEAIAYLETGRARGKVLISMVPDTPAPQPQ